MPRKLSHSEGTKTPKEKREKKSPKPKTDADGKPIRERKRERSRSTSRSHSKDRSKDASKEKDSSKEISRDLSKDSRENHEESVGSMANITSESRRVHRTLELICEEYQDSINKLAEQSKNNELSNAEKSLLRQRIVNVEKNVEKLSMAVEESEILRAFGNYILYQQCDNHKNKMMNIRLEAENDWLQKEFDKLEDKKKAVTFELNNFLKEKETLQECYYSAASGLSLSPDDKLPYKSMKTDVSELMFPLPPKLSHIGLLIEQFINNQNFEAGHSLCTAHLTKLKATVGKNHLDYASLLCLNGKLYMMADRMNEAIKCFHEALPAIHKSNNIDSVSSLYNHISECYFIEGDMVDAEKNAMKALALIEKAQSSMSPEFIVQLCIMGFLGGLCGKFSDADKYLQLAVSQWSTVKLHQSMLLKVRLFSAAVSLCAGNIEEAEKKVKSVINDIHFQHSGKATDLNPSFHMVVENPRYQKLDKLKQNVSNMDSNESLIAIQILKYLFKCKNEKSLAKLLDNFLRDPDVENSFLGPSQTTPGESKYFKILTQTETYLNLLNDFIEVGEKKKKSKK